MGLQGVKLVPAPWGCATSCLFSCCSGGALSGECCVCTTLFPAGNPSPTVCATHCPYPCAFTLGQFLTQQGWGGHSPTSLLQTLGLLQHPKQLRAALAVISPQIVGLGVGGAGAHWAGEQAGRAEGHPALSVSQNALCSYAVISGLVPSKCFLVKKAAPPAILPLRPWAAQGEVPACGSGAGQCPVPALCWVPPSVGPGSDLGTRGAGRDCCPKSFLSHPTALVGGTPTRLPPHLVIAQCWGEVAAAKSHCLCCTLTDSPKGAVPTDDCFPMLEGLLLI